MNLQTTLVLLATLGATAYIARAVYRTWAGSGCQSGCGCGPKKETKANLIAAEDLLSRARKGKPGDSREESNYNNSENFFA